MAVSAINLSRLENPPTDTVKDVVAQSRFEYLMDDVDRVIIEELLRDARRSSSDIGEALRRRNVTISDRAVRYRVAKLESGGVIEGYLANVKPEAIGRTVEFLALIKASHELEALRSYRDLDRYLRDAPFCSLVARTSGESDWVVLYQFNSREEAELETLTVRLMFGELIEDFKMLPLDVLKRGSVPPFSEEELNHLKQKLTTFPSTR